MSIELSQSRKESCELNLKEPKQADRQMIGIRILAICVALIITMCLSACGGEDEAPSPATVINASDLQIVESGVIDPPGNILSFSPDGRWLFYRGGESGSDLCVYDISLLIEKTCASLDEHFLGFIHTSSIDWSTDSHKLVFTENYLESMAESDLWILDIESGELLNITDDSMEGRFQKLMDDGENFQLDLNPSWSQNSEMLVFSRYQFGGGELQAAGILKISADGENPENLLSLDNLFLDNIFWVDGENPRIIYDNFAGVSDPETGIWITDEDGQNNKQLLGVIDPDKGRPLVVDVSAEAGKALVRHSDTFTQEPNVSSYFLLDLTSGSTEPLKEASGEEIEFMAIVSATFSPDGTKVLYVYKEKDGGSIMAVRDLTGGTEYVLGDYPGRGILEEFGLNWCENNMVYAVGGQFEITAMLLGTEE